jgi:hypothetical protein
MEKLFDEEENKEEVVEDEDFEWERDQAGDEDAEVVKLQIGESISGVLMDKFDSVRYGCGIFKIKVKDDDKLKVLLGTTILDKLMKKREIGELIKIERLPDQTSGAGRLYQNFEVYHKK